MKQLSKDALIQGVAAKDAVSLARLISWAENGDPRADAVMRSVFPRTGRAHRIGITGPPGSGKSTLIARLVAGLRERGLSVAVVAVDPTSPFSGGALLGDRYRMQDLSNDPEVFVRSMASRGSQGGLSLAADRALDLLDAAGFDRLLVETVGVGQIEIDVVSSSDTVLVVLVPESGDGIQTMKAGLMEIGDGFVVNKADREGADRLAHELEAMLDLRTDPNGWRPRVCTTAALNGEGTAEVLSILDDHRRHLDTTGAGAERRRQVLRQRILAEARQGFLDRLESERTQELEQLLDRVVARELTPADAARSLEGGKAS